MEKCRGLGGVYVVDTGVDNPTNTGIASLDLSRQTIADGGAVTITAAVDGTGVEGELAQTVDLFVISSAGKRVPRGAAEVKLVGESAATVSLEGRGSRFLFYRQRQRIKPERLEPFLSEGLDLLEMFAKSGDGNLGSH